MSNLENVCRICRCNSARLVNIFVKLRQPCDALSLAEMLNECIDCNIRPDDPFPKQICFNCILEASNAYKFKRKCEQSHLYFCQILQVKENFCEDLHDLRNCNKAKENYKEPTETQASAEVDLSNVSPSAGDENKWDDASEVPTARRCNIAHKMLFKSKEHYMEYVTKNKFKCPNCPRRFSTAGYLKRHLRMYSAQKPPNPYKCRNCGKTFAQTSYFWKHICLRTEKLLHCSYCPKKFYLKSSLERHVALHSEKRPYKCPYCNKMFMEKANLKNHETSNACRRSFTCTHCFKVFNKRSNLNRHLKKHAEIQTNISKNISKRIENILCSSSDPLTIDSNPEPQYKLEPNLDEDNV